jgi:hypothetical protein
MSQMNGAVTVGFDIDWAGAPEGWHGAYVKSDDRYVYIVESIGCDDTEIRIPLEHANKLARLISAHGKARAAIA